jgi:hypothetical protein
VQAGKPVGTTVFVTPTVKLVVVTGVDKCVVAVLVVVGVIITVEDEWLHTVCGDIVELVNNVVVVYAIAVMVEVVKKVETTVDV